MSEPNQSQTTIQSKIPKQQMPPQTQTNEDHPTQQIEGVTIQPMTHETIQPNDLHKESEFTTTMKILDHQMERVNELIKDFDVIRSETHEPIRFESNDLESRVEIHSLVKPSSFEIKYQTQTNKIIQDTKPQSMTNTTMRQRPQYRQKNLDHMPSGKTQIMIQKQTNIQPNDEQNFPRPKPMHLEPIPTLVEPRKLDKESGFEFLDPNMFNELQEDIEKLKSEVRKMPVKSSMPLERIKPSDPINESEAPLENQHQETVRPTFEIQRGSPYIGPTISLEKTLEEEPQSHDVLTSEPHRSNTFRRSNDNDIIRPILGDEHNFHNEVESSPVLALIKTHLNARLRLQSILKGLPCPPLTNPIIISRDHIEYFEKKQIPRVESPSQASTPINSLE